MTVLGIGSEHHVFSLVEVKQIGIIGMGRVGLTLGIALAGVGFKILGVERDANIARKLRAGEPHFYEKGMKAMLARSVKEGALKISQEIDEKQDAYIICVGTPINKKTKEVVLDPVVRATEEVAAQIKEGDTVIVRSTVPLGTTRNIILPTLNECGQKFCLAYCPERTIEGNALAELRENAQIIGGLNEESIARARDIFSKLTSTTVYVESLEAAELIKLVDNTYRDINFAFSNEIALLAEKLGIDSFKLTQAANFGYRRNNIPIPGFVGGACLSKDPYILCNSAASLGYEVKLAKWAREINEALPIYVAQKLRRRLSSKGKDIAKAKIFVIGIAFKGEPRTDDMRDSPALSFIEHLRSEYGCDKIYGYDFVAPPEEIAKVGVEPCSLEAGFSGADCIVIMNNNAACYDLNIEGLVALMNKPAIFFDGWHMFDAKEIEKHEGMIYGSLGVG